MGYNYESYFPAMNNIVHYQLINGNIHRSRKCTFPQRCAGIEKFLVDVIRRNTVGDVEFFVNVYDHPIFYPDRQIKLPILTFSKPDNPDYYHILYPAWTFWQGKEF